MIATNKGPQPGLAPVQVGVLGPPSVEPPRPVLRNLEPLLYRVPGSGGIGFPQYPQPLQGQPVPGIPSIIESGRLTHVNRTPQCGQKLGSLPGLRQAAKAGKRQFRARRMTAAVRSVTRVVSCWRTPNTPPSRPGPNQGTKAISSARVPTTPLKTSRRVSVGPNLTSSCTGSSWR